MVEAIFANLPIDVPRRMLSATAEKLHLPNETLFLRQVKSSGPGGALAVTIGTEEVTNVFTGFAGKGVASEGVAFLTTRPSGHTKTNIETIRHFNDVPIVIKQHESAVKTFRVDVG